MCWGPTKISRTCKLDPDKLFAKFLANQGQTVWLAGTVQLVPTLKATDER